MKILVFLIIYSPLFLITSVTILADESINNSDVWQKSNKEIRAELTKIKDMAAIEGMSIGLSEKGAAITDFAIGYANSETKEMVETDTIFQAASLSKPVLAYIVLRMAERGEIELDAPLFKVLDNPRIKDKKWVKLITPRLVLSHQTGLPNWGGEFLEFGFEPGTSYSYSGEGYVYLQRVLEELTGLSYQELSIREVFKPLGMSDSYFTWNKDQQLKLALGHDRAGQQNEVPIPDANAAASLHTTATDYLKFIRAWLSDEYLTEESRKIAFTTATDTSSFKPELTEITWGLGWGLYDTGKSNMAWHWGDNGTFRGFVIVEQETQRAMVYFTNSQNGLAIIKQMTELFFPGNPAVNEWLGYGQADSEFWQAERMGYVYAAEGDYAKAIKQLKKVLEEFPKNNRIKNKIKWLKPLAENRPSTIELTPEYIEKVVGQYDVRRIFVEDGQLKYQRGEGPSNLLTPLYDQFFKVGNIGFFRLEIVFDDKGNPLKLVGHYEGGGKDESPRTHKHKN